MLCSVEHFERLIILSIYSSTQSFKEKKKKKKKKEEEEEEGIKLKVLASIYRQEIQPFHFVR
jgi:anaerobic ribonucleoside-triphosphate reductase